MNGDVTGIHGDRTTPGVTGTVDQLTLALLAMRRMTDPRIAIDGFWLFTQIGFGVIALVSLGNVAMTGTTCWVWFPGSRLDSHGMAHLFLVSLFLSFG
jgi:hypothetical protein